MDGRPNLRLYNVILDVQIMQFGPKSLYGNTFKMSCIACTKAYKRGVKNVKLDKSVN